MKSLAGGVLNEIPFVEDKEPMWLKALKLVAWIAGIAGVVFLLVYFAGVIRPWLAGIGGGMRLFTRSKDMEHSRLMHKMLAGTISEAEYVAARRADKGLDAAYRLTGRDMIEVPSRARSVEPSGGPSLPSPSPPAPSSGTSSRVL